MPRKMKVGRMIPTEAIMVSLVGRPSAQSSRFTPEEALLRFSDADQDLVQAIMRRQEPKIPEGLVAQEIQCGVKEIREDGEDGSVIVKAQVYNSPWDPAEGATVSREEADKHLDTYRTYMNAESIQWLAHRFMEVGRGIDVNHDEQPGRATVVESFVAGKDWAPYDEGAWVMGVRVSEPDLIKRVKMGLDEATRNNPEALTGFSIHILTKKEERTIFVDEPSEEEVEERTKRGIVEMLLGAIGISLKGDKVTRNEDPEENQVRAESTDFASVWAAQVAEERMGAVIWTLRRVLAAIGESEDSDKATKYAAAFDAAKATFVAMSSTRGQALRGWDLDCALEVERATGQPMEGLTEAVRGLEQALANRGGQEPLEVLDMTVEELKALLSAELKPMADRLDSMETKLSETEGKRSQGGGEGGGDALTADSVREVIRSEMKPMADRLDAMEPRLKSLEGTTPARRSGEGEDKNGEEQREERPWANIVG